MREEDVIKASFFTAFPELYKMWFKYDRDYLCVNKSQFVPVIFEPPYINVITPEDTR
jgi:hypothetical protein